jgi:hypothetical protein
MLLWPLVLAAVCLVVVLRVALALSYVHDQLRVIRSEQEATAKDLQDLQVVLLRVEGILLLMRDSLVRQEEFLAIQGLSTGPPLPTEIQTALEQLDPPEAS